MSIISKVYNFNKLSSTDQYKVLGNLTEHINNEDDLGWGKNRIKVIIPLCKQLINNELTLSESLILQNTISQFDNISDYIILDTCLMFWQITHDEKYLNIITNHANNISSPVHKHSLMIINSCLL